MKAVTTNLEAAVVVAAAMALPLRKTRVSKPSAAATMMAAKEGEAEVATIVLLNTVSGTIKESTNTIFLKLSVSPRCRNDVVDSVDISIGNGSLSLCHGLLWKIGKFMILFWCFTSSPTRS